MYTFITTGVIFFSQEMFVQISGSVLPHVPLEGAQELYGGAVELLGTLTAHFLPSLHPPKFWRFPGSEG